MGGRDVLEALRLILAMPEDVIVKRVLEIFPPACPDCGSRRVVKIGGVFRTSGLRVQRFRCKACGRTFTVFEGTPLKGLHDIRLVIVVAYLVLCLGMEPRTIARATGRSYSTVLRVYRRVIKNEKFFKTLLSELGITSVTACPYR